MVVVNKRRIAAIKTHGTVAEIPHLAAEWHPAKNGNLNPNDLPPGSDKKVWWRCSKGPDHEWQAPVYNRTGNKSGCPYCAGKKVSVTNSLAHQYPAVAKQWHPKKNGKVTPDQVTKGSSKHYWWNCPKVVDHEWKASVFHRTSGGQGCPLACPH
jgi:hypothetical protein